MKKAHKTLAGLIFTIGACTGAGLAGKQIIEKYHGIGIEKLNAIEGVEAIPLQLDVGLTQSTAATMIRISSAKAGVVSEVLTGNQDIVMVIDSTFSYKNTFPEPNIVHSAIFDKATSKSISDRLNVDIEKDTLIQVPAQVVSYHPSDGTIRLLGLSDDLKYGDTLNARPIKFGLATNSLNDEIKITARGESISAINDNNETLNVSDFSLLWDGTFSNCEPICQGAQNLTAKSLKLIDASGEVTTAFTDLAVGASAYSNNDHYTINLTLMSEDLKTELLHWNSFVFKSEVTDISTTGLAQFTDDISKLQSFGNNDHMANQFAQEMYARLLQSGMTFAIDELSANTNTGPMRSNIKIALPANKMPNMISNPLGVMTVLEGNFSALVPSAEIDRLTAPGTASSFIQSGFAVPADGGQNIKTDIVVKGGQATINGQVVSL